MRKYLLTFIALVFISFGAKAQLFQSKDVAKIADYVVDELQLTGTTAANVKSIYESYGQKMNAVMKSNKGLNAKQNEVKTLTKEMDDAVKAKLPANKRADYDTVAEHYRKKGITTSALNSNNNKTISGGKSNETQSAKLEEAKSEVEKLKQDIKDQLGVNDAQADQLVKITLGYALQKKVINQTYKANPTQRNQKMNELNLSTNKKVKGMLNDQQYKKFLLILLKEGKK